MLAFSRDITRIECVFIVRMGNNGIEKIYDKVCYFDKIERCTQSVRDFFQRQTNASRLLQPTTGEEETQHSESKSKNKTFEIRRSEARLRVVRRRSKRAGVAVVEHAVQCRRVDVRLRNDIVDRDELHGMLCSRE